MPGGRACHQRPAHRRAAGTAVVEAAPGHVENVRRHVIDALTPEQVDQLDAIGDALLPRLDPDEHMSTLLRMRPTAPS